MVRLLSQAFIASINKTLDFRRSSISKAKDFLTREENGILNAALILMILALATKFTGLVFNAMATGYLGAGPYNEFLFASNLPEIISASILLGAISAAVIPALVQAKEEAGYSKFIDVLSTLINVTLLLFVLVAVIVAIAAPLILPWLVENVIKPVDMPGPEEMDRAVLMLRVLMIPQIILGISTFVSSSLNVMQRFVVPQLAPLFYNFGRIAGILVLLPFIGKSPWVLVWGTLIGAIFHLIIQLPLASHLKITYRPVIGIKDKYFKNIVQLGSPRVLGLSAEQVAIGVDRLIAYGLVGYSLTAYELGVRLIAIPMSLFGMTFSTAAFPILSKAFVKKDMVLFKDTFTNVLNQIFFLALPVSVILLVLRLPMTRLFYGILGDSFTWDDTRKVAWVVLFFAFGLTFESLRTLLYRTYYALHNSMIPLLSAGFVVFGGIVTGILFTNYFSHFDELSLFNLKFDLNYFLTKEDGMAGVGGLAFSASLIYTIEAFALVYFLNRKYLKMKFSSLLKPLAKKFLVAIITLVLTYSLYALYNDVLDTSKTSRILFLTSTTALASCLFYLWLSYQFGIKEIEMVEKLMVRLKRLVMRKPLK
ncbi:MAG: Virulence factor MviN [candidate division WS6 bacterium GW2011_GWA2_37_6]|uniref:Virulence factor MviN n=1 Tax=candidate division WS6 bacterium GW2011_GWA2_37_6 TaxID=1619087 RepID=A0A0G0JE04_9BACT|nr:MAG: Virulence factor MviN [candidate division WS6 bacterium GW2011_GWA2_37_6]